MNPIPNDDRPTDHGQASDVRGTHASDLRTLPNDRPQSPTPATGGERA